MNNQQTPPVKVLFVGTYTTNLDHVSGKGRGIYSFFFDPITGQLSATGNICDCVNPSYLSIHPSHRYLYAVNETREYINLPSGTVSSYSIDPETYDLTLLNQKASLGADPCYLSVDNRGHYLFVANYTGGNFAIFPIKDDGSLGDNSEFVQHYGFSVNPNRQSAPHAHSIVIEPNNRFAYCADLGIDKVVMYPFDQQIGKIVKNSVSSFSIAPGSGPRHIVFHPQHYWMYLINELGSTITCFQVNPEDGLLKEFQTIKTLPEDYSGVNICADIHIHPSGKFLYGSNRGHNSIVAYEINTSGNLKYLSHQSTHGQIPRNFIIDQTGRWLMVANQDSNNIVTFSIDTDNGLLKNTGMITEVPSPVCLKFLDYRGN